MRTLTEMKIGSEPDETADYFEEIAHIDKWIMDLESTKNNISDSNQSFLQKRADVDAVKKQATRNSSPEHLKMLCDNLQKDHEEIEGLINEAFDY